MFCKQTKYYIITEDEWIITIISIPSSTSRTSGRQTLRISARSIRTGMVRGRVVGRRMSNRKGYQLRSSWKSRTTKIRSWAVCRRLIVTLFLTISGGILLNLRKTRCEVWTGSTVSWLTLFLQLGMLPSSRPGPEKTKMIIMSIGNNQKRSKPYLNLIRRTVLKRKSLEQ